MTQIKIFTDMRVDYLETRVNEWMDEEMVTVKDVKYQSSTANSYASVLVIYEVDEN